MECPAPAVAAQKGTGISREWGEFLNTFSWNWYCTLTFRYMISPGLARQYYRDFFADIQNVSDSPLGWFAVEERGSLGRLHVHALLIGMEHLNRREWERAWFKRAGTAVILEYDPSRGASYYCAKHLGQPDTDYEMSGNLSTFKSTSKRANDHEYIATTKSDLRGMDLDVRPPMFSKKLQPMPTRKRGRPPTLKQCSVCSGQAVVNIAVLVSSANLRPRNQATTKTVNLCGQCFWALELFISSVGIDLNEVRQSIGTLSTAR